MLFITAACICSVLIIGLLFYVARLLDRPHRYNLSYKEMAKITQAHYTELDLDKNEVRIKKYSPALHR